MESIDWNLLYGSTDVNIAAEIFQAELLQTVDKHVPFCKLKVHENAPPWLNMDYLFAVDTREYWSHKFKLVPNEYNFNMKIWAAQACHRLKNKLKESYFSNALEQARGYSAKTWRIIKKFWPYKKKTTNINSINGETSDLGKASEINNFFANVALNLERDMPVVHEND